MRRIGIVGSEAAKFTAKTERIARKHIRSLIADADLVISGQCHLGGIDLWAIEEAAAMGIATQEYPAMTRQWSTGYKPRNLQIAQGSDVVYCITVVRLPDHYTGMRFPLCYHCGTDAHVKSGGCWTVKQARKLGKHGAILCV